jgi:bacillolysin
MKKRILFFCLIIILVLFVASTPILQQYKNSADQEFKKVVKRVSENGWVYFKDNFKPDPNKFFSKYMEEFNLSKDDIMKLVKEETDSVYQFYRYKHYYKNILVEGSSMTLQFKNGYAELAFGTLAKNLNIDIKNTVKEGTAFEEAKKNLKAELFAWESKKWESLIKKERKDSSATWLPKGELVITYDNISEFKLVYKFNILTVSPNFDYIVCYIDAFTGKHIKMETLFDDATSPGITFYNGERTFTTYFKNQFPRGHWQLEDRTRNICAKLSNIYFIPGEGWNTTWDSDPVLNDWDNYWDWLSERPAVSSQWATEIAYDYFHQSPFNRHGVDDNNKYLKISSMWEDFNAGYFHIPSADYAWIGVGYFNDTSFAALDIIGHEFTHGINRHTALLRSVAQESGALSESFSDIFGECIESYVNGSCDWLVGGDFFTSRSFSNPHESHYRYSYDHGHQPEYWEEYGYWYSGDDPGIYTHKNCSVQNRWFYLLVNGNAQLGISGIGLNKAARITYRNLTTYLNNTPDATFNIAREGSVNAAAYYYGECSLEYQQVMNAWAAVGVGDPAPDPCLAPPLEVTIEGPTACTCGNFEYWFTYPTGGNGTYTYQWYLNGNPISTSSSCWHIFEEWETGYNNIAVLVTSGDQTVLEDLNVWVDCYTKGGAESEMSLLLYPNPASKVATLEIIENNDSKMSLKDKDCLLYLFDKNGKIFYNIKTKNRRIDIDVSNLQEGVYTLVALIGECKSNVNLSIVH